jgi:hypothetical protein
MRDIGDVTWWVRLARKDLMCSAGVVQKMVAHRGDVCSRTVPTCSWGWWCIYALQCWWSWGCTVMMYCNLLLHYPMCDWWRHVCLFVIVGSCCCDSVNMLIVSHAFSVWRCKEKLWIFCKCLQSNWAFVTCVLREDVNVDWHVWVTTELLCKVGRLLFIHLDCVVVSMLHAVRSTYT